MTKVIDFFEYSDSIDVINKWGRAYATGAPIVDDSTYDALYKELKLFELNNPTMIDSNSPTQNVADDKVDGFPKHKHQFPMGSIGNSNGIEEVEQWANKMSGTTTNLIAEYKIDGLALSLIYIDGLLTNAITRGDGTTGDVVLNNALRIKSIPKTIDVKGIFEVRGEVVWYKEDFIAYNKTLEDLGKEPMSNPRNGASGTMKSKDPNEVENRVLNFIAYKITQHEDENLLHSMDLTFLQSIGFTTSEFYVTSSVESIVEKAEYMRSKREELPYLIDGVVIKVNNKEFYTSLGGTVKNPNWCTAYKFPPEEKETKLKYIEESYGRSGAVTPVAVLETIELALTNVSRVSLHNWDTVDYMGLYEGCTVSVRKAGEIIPEIVRCVESDRTKDEYEKVFSTITDSNERKFILNLVIDENELKIARKQLKRPTHCEHCNTQLTSQVNNKGESLVSWICPNNACSVKQYENIVRFVSKDAMNIYGVGESLIESMLSVGIIKDISNLYDLTLDDVLKIDGIKDKSAENIINAIKQSRENDLERLLVGFGINGFGRTSSKIIAKKYRDLANVSLLTKDELLTIDGIGDETATNVVQWFSTNEQLVNYFIAHDIACNSTSLQVLSDSLKGKTLIMTGSFDSLPRDEFKTLVEKHGGTISSSINKKVDYVVLGDGAGPAKVKKIDEVNALFPNKITIINDIEFMKLIGE